MLVELTERQYELIDQCLEAEENELNELADDVSQERQNEIEELRAYLWESREMDW